MSHTNYLPQKYWHFNRSFIFLPNIFCSSELIDYVLPTPQLVFSNDSQPLVVSSMLAIRVTSTPDSCIQEHWTYTILSLPVLFSQSVTKCTWATLVSEIFLLTKLFLFFHNFIRCKYFILTTSSSVFLVFCLFFLILSNDKYVHMVGNCFRIIVNMKNMDVVFIFTINMDSFMLTVKCCLSGIFQVDNMMKVYINRKSDVYLGNAAKINGWKIEESK